MLVCLVVKHTEGSVREDLDDSCWRDTVSIGSTDSFVSAAEVGVVRIRFCSHVVLEN